MYVYSISTGNPEGIDWVADFQHNEKFTQEEFTELVEAGFAAFGKQEANNYSASHLRFVCTTDSTDFMIKYMKEHGFILQEYAAAYHLEPYWGERHVKNPVLKAMFDTTEENQQP